MNDREFIKKVKVLIDKFVSEWIYLNGEYEKSDIVKVITKQEEDEQDKDERDMDEDFEKEHSQAEPEELELRKEMDENCNVTKTYDNPFPTDEALDFDVNVRERV